MTEPDRTADDVAMSNVYDDPAALADILRSAIDAAEREGKDGQEIGLEVLRATVRHLAKIARREWLREGGLHGSRPDQPAG